MKQKLRIGKRRFEFHSPSTDLETIWEQTDNKLDPSWEENIPYWVEIWPAGIVLAEWLLENRHKLKNQNCLDLGCGLGISTCAAAACATKITAIDHEWEALCYAKYNLKANNLTPVNLLHMDWQYPALKAQTFDFIWGADVLYESRFFFPLLQLFRRVLAPGGKIWLSAPDRKVTHPFWDLLKKADWKLRIVRRRQQVQDREQQIYLWELKKD